MSADHVSAKINSRYSLSRNRSKSLDLLRIFCVVSVVMYHYQIGSRNRDAWQSFTFGEFLPTWSTNVLLSN